MWKFFKNLSDVTLSFKILKLFQKFSTFLIIFSKVFHSYNFHTISVQL